MIRLLTAIIKIVLYFMKYAFIVLSLTLMILKFYDYYLIKKEIWLRKAIGQFKTETSWEKAVRDICCKWSVSMPKVQVSDNQHFVLLEKLSRRFYTKELQAWQRGSVMLGLAEYINGNPEDQKTKDIFKDIINVIFDENYNWRDQVRNIDYAVLAYSIMKFPQYDDTFYRAMEKVVNIILDHIGEDGTILYRKSIPTYRLVDTLGMVCAFLVRFGELYNRPELVNLAIKQIEEYVKYGIHSNLYIPAHGYHVEHKIPLGIYGWGRGVGWYALALLDTYNELQDKHPAKEFIKEQIVLLASTIVKLQREDGGWGHSLLLKDNIHDSSATAVCTYFLGSAICKKIISYEVYNKYVERGIHKLQASTRKNGIVDFSQGDTKGIGIYSFVFRELPFTQGITLRAITAVNSLKYRWGNYEDIISYK